MRGPATYFPIAGSSKKQGSVSKSTPEAEMVAMDGAMRMLGLPALSLYDAILQRKVTLVVHEDNQAMIRIVETGKNIALRYLLRTHRISIAWLHEVFKMSEIELVYAKTDTMCADIYTKAFSDQRKWEAACWLIGVIDPTDLVKIVALGDSPPPPGGGGPQNPSSP
jgi:hypothetical protein